MSAKTPWTEPEFVVTRRGVYGPVGPAREGVTGGVIPAGERHVVGETTQPMSRLSAVNGKYVPGEIIGMTPHMHGLGTRLSVKLNDGHEDACMVDVPNWDFEWQLDYSFSEPHLYEPEQMLTVRCEYDNGPVNLAILDGMRIAPRDVGWGEGTLDDDRRRGIGDQLGQAIEWARRRKRAGAPRLTLTAADPAIGDRQHVLCPLAVRAVVLNARRVSERPNPSVPSTL